MNAIPALIAGVKRIIMINPRQKGKQNPAVLYAARKCKIKEIYSIGTYLYSNLFCNLSV